VKKGKTPVLSPDEARRVLDGIDVTTHAGLRDRALIGLMVYSFARVGAAPTTLLGIRFAAPTCFASNQCPGSDSIASVMATGNRTDATARPRHRHRRAR
jgi:hypothetical protein